MRVLLSLLLSGILLFAADNRISAAKYARLVAKGEKIALRICDPHKLPGIEEGEDNAAIEKALEASGACPALSPGKRGALVAFLRAGGVIEHQGTKRLDVPEGAKCPVCGMFVSKYPKWAAEMVVAGKKHYFDGVKDMMKYYFFDGDFPYDRSKIEAMKVTDFYTLEPVDARKAWYVLGSNVYGPMGNELVPFKDEASAKNFLRDHKGERIVRFNEITPKVVMALDGRDRIE